MAAAYSENGVRADAEFGGKKIILTYCYIESIRESGNLDNGATIADIQGASAYVDVEANDELHPIHCYFDDSDELMNLHVGERVTIQGQCDGLKADGNIYLEGCSIIKKQTTVNTKGKK